MRRTLKIKSRRRKLRAADDMIYQLLTTAEQNSALQFILKWARIGIKQTRRTS
jgi:hypothetical protein